MEAAQTSTCASPPLIISPKPPHGCPGLRCNLISQTSLSCVPELCTGKQDARPSQGQSPVHSGRHSLLQVGRPGHQPLSGTRMSRAGAALLSWSVLYSICPPVGRCLSPPLTDHFHKYRVFCWECRMACLVLQGGDGAWARPDFPAAPSSPAPARRPAGAQRGFVD